MTWRANVAMSLGGLALLSACSEATATPDLEATVTAMVATQIAGQPTATPLPTPTSTPTPTVTPTRIPVPTPTPSPTPISVATPPTSTPTRVPTATPTSTVATMPTPTATETPTSTPLPTPTPTPEPQVVVHWARFLSGRIGGEHLTVPLGADVELYVTLSATSPITGNLEVEVRKDFTIGSDKTEKLCFTRVSLTPDLLEVGPCVFTPTELTSSHFRQYFISCLLGREAYLLPGGP